MRSPEWESIGGDGLLICAMSAKEERWSILSRSSGSATIYRRLPLDICAQVKSRATPYLFGGGEQPRFVDIWLSRRRTNACSIGDKPAIVWASSWLHISRIGSFRARPRSVK